MWRAVTAALEERGLERLTLPALFVLNKAPPGTGARAGGRGVRGVFALVCL